MSKKTRRKQDKIKQVTARTPEELAHLHRFCVSVKGMQESYLRSLDYELCDGDGQLNPIGKFVRSRRTGLIKPIRGQCSFELLSDGSPNPAWLGCPYGDSDKTNVLPPPDINRIDALLNAMGVEGPIVATVQITEEPAKEEEEEDDALAHLEKLLAARKARRTK